MVDGLTDPPGCCPSLADDVATGVLFGTGERALQSNHGRFANDVFKRGV